MLKHLRSGHVKRNILSTSNSVTTNRWMRRMSLLRLKLDAFPTAGMMSSNTSVTTNISRRLLKRNRTIKSRSLSVNLKIRTGGGPSEISLISEILDSLINNLSSLIGFGVEKQPVKPWLTLAMKSSTITTIPFQFTHILLPNVTLCLPSGSR